MIESWWEKSAVDTPREGKSSSTAPLTMSFVPLKELPLRKDTSKVCVHELCYLQN